VVSLFPAAPAAGANYIFTVPAGYVYLIGSLSFLFTASVAVASRLVFVNLYHGGAVKYVAPSSRVIAAGEVVQITCGIGLENVSPASVAGLATHTLALPRVLLIGGGGAMQTLISSLQAADTITNVALKAQRWRF